MEDTQAVKPTTSYNFFKMYKATIASIEGNASYETRYQLVNEYKDEIEKVQTPLLHAFVAQFVKSFKGWTLINNNNWSPLKCYQ